VGGLIGAIISSVVGGIIAIRAIVTNRHLARIRATLDLIERTESQEYYQGLYEKFKSFRKSGAFSDRARLEKLLDPETEQEKADRTEIMFFLNHYELIAAGFKNYILDKDFYADFMRGAVVRDWNAARQLIERLRNPDSPLAYEHLEALAREWDFEIRHENVMRREGASREHIEQAIKWLRKDPKVRARRTRTWKLDPHW